MLVVQYFKIHDQYLSPRLSAALTIERSAAVLRSLEAGQAVECPPWHWESHNQDLGGCSCLQPGAGRSRGVEEGFRQQVRRSPCTRWRCCTQLSTCSSSPSSSSSGWGRPAGLAEACSSSWCLVYSPSKLLHPRTERYSSPGSGAKHIWLICCHLDVLFLAVQSRV